jgi:methylated-DNA-[protein]-cysteine S-methyltransferase
MIAYSSTVDTPVGPFTIVATDDAVLASGWTPDVAALHSGVPPMPRADLGPITKAVLAYHDGDLAAIDAVPVAQTSSGAFLSAAWDAMREIRPGEPVSYTGLAARAGRPAAVRAAAQACARNRCALFVPCHRVVRADGSLGGFRWGLPVKHWLLRWEASSGALLVASSKDERRPNLR